MVVLLLFAVSWLIRADEGTWDASPAAVTLGIVGLLVACVTGWLGGELVERLGVSVDPDADLDAPSSLGRPTHRPSSWMPLRSEPHR